ncbi:FlgT C-terminal domain-containing protein [Maioricimonas rarisocia]|uniref:FlgT C-terminal domain-containing protein n=1 Tax=Maioricimonas rarisocia TaxID=2528026 RepID=UPI0018D23AB2|nr:FlgT C-terminal domain-containing protein [Maioricimonas rarisocia]
MNCPQCHYVMNVDDQLIATYGGVTCPQCHTAIAVQAAPPQAAPPQPPQAPPPQPGQYQQPPQPMPGQPGGMPAQGGAAVPSQPMPGYPQQPHAPQPGAQQPYPQQPAVQPGMPQPAATPYAGRRSSQQKTVLFASLGGGALLLMVAVGAIAVMSGGSPEEKVAGDGNAAAAEDSGEDSGGESSSGPMSIQERIASRQNEIASLKVTVAELESELTQVNGRIRQLVDYEPTSLDASNQMTSPQPNRSGRDMKASGASGSGTTIVIQQSTVQQQKSSQQQHQSSGQGEGAAQLDPQAVLVELNHERGELSAEKTRLERELESRQNLLSMLQSWTSPHFVLGSRQSPNVVGLRMTGSNYVVVAQARGAEQVPWAVAAARKSQVPRVGLRKAQELARQIYDTVELNEPIPTSMSTQIDESIWRSWQFVGVEPDVPVDFAVFHSSRWNSQQVGVLREVRDDAMVIRRLAKEDESIRRSDIQLGSLWVANGREVASAIEVGDSFLDYALLNVAQKLSFREGERGFVRVAIHANIDRLVKDFESGTNTELFRIHYGNEFRHFAPRPGRGLDGGGTGFRRDVVENQVRPTQMLRGIARALEDDIYSKLVEVGIPVVEREYGEQLKLEQSYKHVSDIREFAKLADATHMLICELDDSLAGGRYRLTVRLTDLSNGVALWSGSDDETIPVIRDANPFVLQTGDPVLMKPVPPEEGEEINLDFLPFESPMRAPFVGAAESRLPREPLVLLEARLPDALVYRPLFSRQTYTVPSTAFEPDIVAGTSAKQLNESAIRGQLLRYIVWRLARRALTPAGRVVQVTDDGRSADINLGRRFGIKNGDTLRVLRETHSTAGGETSVQLGPREMLLPARLTVSNVLEDSSRVNISHNEFEGGWGLDEYRPQVGDVVVSRVEPRRDIVIFPPGWTEPAGVFLKQKLQWANPNHRSGHIQNVLQVGRTIQEKLALGMKEIAPVKTGALRLTRSRNVDADATLAEAGKSGATHVLGGELEWVSANRFRCTMKLRELEYTGSRWAFGDSLETVEFEIGDGEW